MRLGIVVTGQQPNIVRQFSVLRKLIDEKGLKIDIVGPEKYFSLKDTDLMTGTQNKKSLFRFLKLFRSCFGYVRAFNPHALISFPEITLTIPVVTLFSVFSRKKLVIRFSGDLFNAYKHFKPPKKQVMYLAGNLVNKQCLKLANKIIVLGETRKEYLYKEGFNPDKIHVIPPFVDRDSFFPAKNKIKLREKLNLPIESKIVLSVGRVSRLKGMHVLQEVIERLENDKDITFCIVGDGELKTKLSQHSNVITIGHVEPEIVDMYYKAAELLILTSPMEELPNVILESMACGTPVLTTSVGVIPDIIKDGETGFILESNSPDYIAKRITEALNHPSLDRIKSNGVELIDREFDSERLFDKWKEVLKTNEKHSGHEFQNRRREKLI